MHVLIYQTCSMKLESSVLILLPNGFTFRYVPEFNSLLIFTASIFFINVPWTVFYLRFAYARSQFCCFQFFRLVHSFVSGSHRMLNVMRRLYNAFSQFWNSSIFQRLVHVALLLLVVLHFCSLSMLYVLPIKFPINYNIFWCYFPR